MKRFLAAFSPLFLAATSILAQSVTPPPVETLRDLRAAVAQGKLKGAPGLCDRLRSGYEIHRASEITDATDPTAKGQAALDTFMACYCIYAKAQVLALLGQPVPAQASLTEAQAYRARYPEFSNPRVQPIMQDLDILTAGVIQERSGQLDQAVQTYLPATFQAGPEAAVATGRLAAIELKRGHADKAQSWAYIHADDPTSQYVLAQIAVQKKNLLVAQRHATQAVNELQKELKGGKEYMPLFFTEAPAVLALKRKLPPLPAPPKPAAPKPKPAAPKPPVDQSAPAPAPGPAPAQTMPKPAADPMAPGSSSPMAQ